MEVTVATQIQDGYVSIIGVWHSKEHSVQDIIKEITKEWLGDYGEEPEFGDHGIELHTSFVD